MRRFLRNHLSVFPRKGCAWIGLGIGAAGGCTALFLLLLISLLLLGGVCGLFRLDYMDKDETIYNEALFKYAFGCAFRKTYFIDFAVVETQKKKAQVCLESQRPLWEDVAKLWRDIAVKRSVPEQWEGGTTWPQTPPLSPIYILYCPNRGFVFGQDPQTHRVQFVLILEQIQFKVITGEGTSAYISSWDTLQIKVWDGGIPWKDVPSRLPEVLTCAEQWKALTPTSTTLRETTR